MPPSTAATASPRRSARQRAQREAQKPPSTPAPISRPRKRRRAPKSAPKSAAAANVADKPVATERDSNPIESPRKKDDPVEKAPQDAQVDAKDKFDVSSSADHSPQPRKRSKRAAKDDADYEPSADDDSVPKQPVAKASKPRRGGSPNAVPPVPSTQPWGLTAVRKILKIVTWNICSCRTAVKNGYLKDYITRECPDVLCIQETKMTDEAERNFPELEGYVVHWNHSKKKGYSGVATLLRKDLKDRKGVSVQDIGRECGDDEADKEARVLTVFLDCGLAIVNCYVPNAGGKLARLAYRTETFEPGVRKYLNQLVDKYRVVYCGDLNVAHEEIDIHNSKGNTKNAGHTPQERAQFSELLTSGKGWKDSFRELCPNDVGFTFYSKRFGPKLKVEGKGWRLDYHVVDRGSFEKGVVQDVYTRPEVEGSDHVPLVIDYEIEKKEEERKVESS